MRVALIFFFVLMAAVAMATAEDVLLVYTYDSFASWGPAAAIEASFEDRYDVDVQFLALSDSREMLARLIDETGAGRPTADVFIGVEAADLARVKRLGLFEPLSPAEVPSLDAIPEPLLLDPDRSLVPYEHGYITLVYDAEAMGETPLPRTFEELAGPEYREMLILEDPRISSPGLSFLLWTIHRFGDPGYLQYWDDLLPNVLTIAGGWSEAYNLFLAGEAPMVVSFSTDTAYSVIAADSTRYRVLLLDNQGYRTLYLMGVVRDSPRPILARALIDLVLSVPIQELIPTTEWMFPAHPDALLPIPFYQYAVVPPQPVMLDPEFVDQNLDRWLREWARAIFTG
jgi:thiamine transport system substrate-binding protein